MRSPRPEGGWLDRGGPGAAVGRQLRWPRRTAYRGSPRRRPCHKSVVSEGTGGVVNELLVQMQSFDESTGGQRMLGWLADKLNLLLPAHRQITPTSLACVQHPADRRDQPRLGAGSGAAAPGPVRPGAGVRSARQAGASRPDRPDARPSGRMMPELDEDQARDHIAALTTGYTPARLENLFDEALVETLRRGSRSMNSRDVHKARLVADVGLGQPVAYTDHEARLIATHEAGHAVVAHIAAPQRRLEVLTIIKRKDALGLLAHNDTEDVFTRVAQRTAGADPDRVRRHGRRGAVLRGGLHRTQFRPELRDHGGGADGRCRPEWSVP